MSSHAHSETGSPSARTKDPVNQSLIDLRDRVGVARLGLMNNQVWHDDPKRLAFTLARYKFVAKMLKGRERVLEVGCGDAFGSRLVRQDVKSLLATDFDPLFIEDARQRMSPPWDFEVATHDILAGPVPGQFDAAYTLDVLEHIPATHEDIFLDNIKASLTEHGTCIVGMPSLESQSYASPASRAGHINCMTGEHFRQVMERHFHNVFIFSMNDEVVHTGFLPMAHYLLAIACSKRLRAAGGTTTP